MSDPVVVPPTVVANASVAHPRVKPKTRPEWGASTGVEWRLPSRGRQPAG